MPSTVHHKGIPVSAKGSRVYNNCNNVKATVPKEPLNSLLPQIEKRRGSFPSLFFFFFRCLKGMHRGHNGHRLTIYMPNSLMRTFDRSVTDITEERGQRFNLEYTLQEKITQKSRAQLLCNEPEKRIFIGLPSREGFGRRCQMLSLCEGVTLCTLAASGQGWKRHQDTIPAWKCYP